MPEDARAADTVTPSMNLCQRCHTEFDWHETTCPECGWEKDEWVASGRYGLAKSSFRV